MTDPTAQEFYERYAFVISNHVRIWGRRYSLSREESEDMAQECRLRVFKVGLRIASGKLERHPEIEYWTSYAHRTVMSAIFLWLTQNKYDTHKTAGSHGRRMTDDLIKPVDELRLNSRAVTDPESDEDVFDRLRPAVPSHETDIDLKQLRENLPARKQTVLDCVLGSTFFFGLPQQIAELTSLTPCQVETSIKRIDLVRRGGQLAKRGRRGKSCQ